MKTGRNWIEMIKFRLIWEIKDYKLLGKKNNNIWSYNTVTVFIFLINYPVFNQSAFLCVRYSLIKMTYQKLRTPTGE